MRARAAWALGVLSTLLCASATGLYVAADLPPAGRLISFVIVVAFSAVGALVVSSQPRNAIGWIFCGIAFSTGLSAIADAYAHYWLGGNGGSKALAELAAWFESLGWIPGVLVSLTFLLLLFPDGRLPSGRWRPVAWCAALGIACAFAAAGLTAGPLDDFPQIDNPYAAGSELLTNGLLVLALPLLAVALVASPVSLYMRFRRAGTEQRQQIKWLVWGGVLAVASFAVGLALYDVWDGALSNSLILASVLGLAVATGVAIRRYRLYDVDVVIHRTLVYGALTATLAATYFALVLLLQLALSPGSNLAIAGSTLAVAALFRPARARIQSAVDRRFYRRRYDAGRTLASFSAHLRDQVDIEAVHAELRAVVRDTVQPAHVSVWLRAPERQG